MASTASLGVLSQYTGHHWLAAGLRNLHDLFATGVFRVVVSIWSLGSAGKHAHYYTHTHSKLCRSSTAQFDVPFLYLLLCFRQHKVPTPAISTTPTAAMTPIMITIRIESMQLD